MRGQTLLPLHPAVAFPLWLALLACVGIVEGQQAAMVLEGGEEEEEEERKFLQVV
jgi:hypothetical protein